jgi:hypothetical protein
MVRLSDRYSSHVMALLLLSLCPVVIHSYGGLSADDCQIDRLLAQAGPRMDGSGRHAWMIQHFSADKSQEGSLALGSGSGILKTAIIVSHDPKKLYHHPEKRLVRGSANRRGTEWIEADGEQIPIHLIYYDGSSPALFAAYLLVYDSHPVANPYLAPFAAFGTQLVRGRLPMTIFFVSAVGPPNEADAMRRATEQWLIEAWGQYRAACLN